MSSYSRPSRDVAGCAAPSLDVAGCAAPSLDVAGCAAPSLDVAGCAAPSLDVAGCAAPSLDVAGCAAPRATGRIGSEHHSDHEPGYSGVSTPTTASAATTTDAVTPEPQ